METKKTQTVLIVDDTPANIDVLTEALQPLNVKVAVATSGEKGLRVVNSLKPDLILLDVMMPGIDGFETCKRLKAARETCEIPVIFITAKTETEDILNGFKLGAVDYVLKPFRHEEVCARVWTHLELRRSQQELLQLNAQKNKFLGMAAHDLRNPLGAVSSYIEDIIAEDGELSSAERVPILRSIHAVCNEMLSLVSDLLDVSAIEAGHLEIKKIRFNLSEAVKARSRMHVAGAARKCIVLLTDAPPMVEVEADPNRMAQVLDNLISNAIKFSPPEREIWVRVTEDAQGVELSVKDQGPGMTVEDQAKMFQDFQTLSARPTGNEKSTGLGLAIVKKVVDAHGARIRVESAPGQGATFSIRFAPAVSK